MVLLFSKCVTYWPMIYQYFMTNLNIIAFIGSKIEYGDECNIYFVCTLDQS